MLYLENCNSSTDSSQGLLLVQLEYFADSYHHYGTHTARGEMDHFLMSLERIIQQNTWNESMVCNTSSYMGP